MYFAYYVPAVSASPSPSDPGPKAGMQSAHGPGDRLASHDASQHAAPQAEQGQGHVARKNLQVDLGGSRTGRSPSVSPDRGSVPTSPYSVPQIAPMPSSKLCPVCKTTDLTGTGDDKPNFNNCTQCRSMVCNQCGFNPNPHLTEQWPGPEKPQLKGVSSVKKLCGSRRRRKRRENHHHKLTIIAAVFRTRQSNSTSIQHLGKIENTKCAIK
ncbi:hypothetical protein AMECASPLE_022836 [Ameca splendens]|uniref:Zinc finger piccolo-type domain-containing protein n=1 Tax=Ameca splendens TaxID=208324 RepID=A0ABV0Y3Y2_9TELE